MWFLQLPFHGIDPVFLRLGPVELRWYGLMYVLSFAAAFLVMRRKVRIFDLDMTPDDLYDLLFYMILGVMIGGRIGYVIFYDLSTYLENPVSIVAVWRGGMSFHGGLIGTAVAAIVLAKRRHRSFLEIADLAAVAVPVGIALVRVGNFINGELYGRETTVPWAMIFPAGGDVGRHPSQLYEAFLEGVVLFVFLGWLYGRRLGGGTTLWGFLGGYGLVRFMVEFVRQPDAHIGFDLGPFSRGQLLSFPLFVIGTVMLIRTVRSGSATSAARSDPPGKRRPQKK